MSETQDGPRLPITRPAFAEPPRQRRIVSLTLGGASARKQLRIEKERVVIGSVASADVRLAGDGVAPIHAVLEVSHDASGEASATIYDLASETGVFINGTKTVTHALRAGEEITIGRHKIVFTLESGVDADDPWLASGGRKLVLPPGEDVKPLLLEDERDIVDIFDYRPAQKPALEVVMSWNDTVLDVEHFVSERVVTIGNSRRARFGIPPLASTNRFALASRNGDVFQVHLDQRMRAVVQRAGALKTCSGPSQFDLGRGDFAKVTIGGLEFYLSWTASPPKVRTRGLFERDPLFFKIFFTSMLMTALTIAGLLSVRVPQNLEAEQIPDRIATILYQPEKYGFKPVPTRPSKVQEKQENVAERKERPKPQPTVKIDIKPNKDNQNKTVPEEMNVSQRTGRGTHGSRTGGQRTENSAKEGRGARAKGKEGARGRTKGRASKGHQDIASRPSPSGSQGRGGGDSQVADQGNVDLLKGATAQIQDILGNSAAKLGASGNKLKGFGGFTTQGEGGLALGGGGKGGGGTAETTLGGLSDKGSGGGRVGTGKGAVGTGTGIIGGAARVAIRSGGGEDAVVMGSIDADAVEAALLAHKDEFRLCYEREINAENPYLAGRVGTSFVIGSSGKVTQAGIESTTLRNPNAERCILTVIKRINFPIPRGGGIVQVTYPFKFSPIGH